jgi:Flp pilus assembly protein TadD
VLRTNPGEDRLGEDGRRLIREYLTLVAADYYELLGVDREATSERIDRAWRQRVSGWRGLALDEDAAPEARTRARELLAKVADARDVLANATRRSNYDRELARREVAPDGPRGTDLRLRGARAAMDEGDWDRAIELLRQVQMAMPGSAEVSCLLGWSLLRYRAMLGPEAADEAVALLRRAALLAPDSRMMRERLAAALEELG